MGRSKKTETVEVVTQTEPAVKQEKVFEPTVLTESQATTVVTKINRLALSIPPCGKLTIKYLDPAHNGKTIRCAPVDAIDWIVTGAGELVE